MSNPFTTPFVCSDCVGEGMQVDMFPGGRCLDCHARRVDGSPLPTATDIVNMWR